MRGLDERQRTVAMLVENLQRQDLNPLKEASGIQRFAGSELGCSQSHVSKRLTQAFEERQGGFGGVTGQVRNALEEVRREQARAEARSTLMSAGVKVLKVEPYYSWHGRKETSPAGLRSRPPGDQPHRRAAPGRALSRRSHRQGGRGHLRLPRPGPARPGRRPQGR